MDKAIEELKRLKSLLELERDGEREEFLVTNQKMPIERLVSRGVAWFPIRIGRSYYNSLNQFVVELWRQASDDDVDSSIESGNTVRLFTSAAPEEPRKPVSYTSSVTYADDKRMVITVPTPNDASALLHANGLGVQLFLDETSYRLMFEALDRVINADSGRLPELRSILHGLTPAKFAHIVPSSFPWLNKDQEAAVNKVIAAKDVAIVHGPPGTGKTTTLVEAISETLRRESQVLVCAQSNMAVDWICEILSARGISLVRIGNPKRVTDNMLEHTYERRFASHPDYGQLWSLRQSIRRMRRSHGDERSHQSLARLTERAIDLEIRINNDIMDNSRVVASTLVGAANKVLTGRKFSTLFIDEAAQAMVPACWVAIAKAGRVILAGDHMQLPPTVKSMEAKRAGLAKSLMESVAESQKNTVSLLTTQYRMNEDIMQFSSNWFYDGKLRAASEIAERGSFLDFECPVEWLNITSQVADDSTEEFIGANFGRINKAEARTVIRRLRHCVESIGVEQFIEDRIDVGIISPYRMQVQLLRQMIASDSFFKPLRKSISVNTVDGFQGQERDMIIVSMVRSNDKGEIGFLSDLRRMNVAMTRAKSKLIIVGNRDTLAHNKFFRELYAYVSDVEAKFALDS